LRKKNLIILIAKNHIKKGETLTCCGEGKMNLDDKLIIDAPLIKSKIIGFIRSTLEKREIDGLLVLYKHCLESITNIHLAIEAVGRKHVKVVVTKGRFVNKQPRERMGLEEINQYLDLPEENIVFINQEKILREISDVFSGRYGLSEGIAISESIPVLNYNLSYFLLRNMVRKEIEQKTFAAPLKKPKTQREKFIQRAIAHYKSQIRLRVLLAFLISETENRSFLGSANKTEWLLGLFTKFGTYHAADFLPLASLYQTQVIQLASHLDLQDFLECKIAPDSPNYDYFFKLSAQEVDRILIRLESGFSLKQIAEDTGISPVAIKTVDYHYQASEYARSVPLIPEL
jgi:NH3-dependent NAD+ synthetase